MNQKLLIYGKIIKCTKQNTYKVKPNTYKVKPIYLIGADLVEFQEFSDIFKKKYNMKLYSIVTVIGGITFLHLVDKFLFRGGDEKVELFLNGKMEDKNAEGPETINLIKELNKEMENSLNKKKRFWRN